jgi:hypothetical protein
MKKLTTFCVALVLLGSAVLAAELKSGLQPGQPIPAFDVLKCAGAADDGVKVGTQLCYRCKYGARPMAMVFTRSASESIAKLASKLDETVAKNEGQQVKAFVNLLGENREDLEAKAKEFGSKNKLANVPVVVPIEFENGPDNYGINQKAEVTVLLATGGKVVASHAFGKGELDEKAVDAVLADVAKQLVK